ncbi:MAG TPA: hypothetical protein VL403_00790 [Candidatus Kryptonia bacterium]|nr:hypothetical protein [Candidatus Kryptonia bacterium]
MLCFSSLSPRVTALAALLLTLAVRANAQCTGDCDGNNAVSVDELVLGVNIALGNAALDRCRAFDRDQSHIVSVDELVAGVNDALNGCPSGSTPTPTVTTAPSATQTPPPGCGNGVVDFNLGETCDDGNTVDGDACPANCRIASCTAAGTTLTVHVNFAPPAGSDVAGLTVFLRYPDGVVRIPGMANDDQVQNSITDLPDGAFSTPNDLDYALRLVIFTTDQSSLQPGLLFTVQFDRCQGAAAPTAADFHCTVESAADADGKSVDGTTCSVTVQ